MNLIQYFCEQTHILEKMMFKKLNGLQKALNSEHI